MSSDQGQELVKTVADQLAINYSPPSMQTNRGQSDGRSRRVGPGQDNVGSGQPGDRRVGSGRPGFRRVWSYGPCQTDVIRAANAGSGRVGIALPIRVDRFERLRRFGRPGSHLFPVRAGRPESVDGFGSTASNRFFGSDWPNRTIVGFEAAVANLVSGFKVQGI